MRFRFGHGSGLWVAQPSSSEPQAATEKLTTALLSLFLIKSKDLELAATLRLFPPAELVIGRGAAEKTRQFKAPGRRQPSFAPRRGAR